MPGCNPETLTCQASHVIVRCRSALYLAVQIIQVCNSHAQHTLPKTSNLSGNVCRCHALFYHIEGCSSKNSRAMRSAQMALVTAHTQAVTIAHGGGNQNLQMNSAGCNGGDPCPQYMFRQKCKVEVCCLQCIAEACLQSNTRHASV